MHDERSPALLAKVRNSAVHIITTPGPQIQCYTFKRLMCSVTHKTENALPQWTGHTIIGSTNKIPKTERDFPAYNKTYIFFSKTKHPPNVRNSIPDTSFAIS